MWIKYFCIAISLITRSYNKILLCQATCSPPVYWNLLWYAVRMKYPIKWETKKWVILHKKSGAARLFISSRNILKAQHNVSSYSFNVAPLCCLLEMDFGRKISLGCRLPKWWDSCQRKLRWRKYNDKLFSEHSFY